MEVTNIKDLTTAIQELGSNSNWTQANIQSYLNGLMHKMTTYTIVSNIIWILFLLAGITIGYIYLKKYKKREDCDMLECWVVISSVFLIFAVIFIVGLSLDIYPCLVAPELVFINSLIS